MAVKCVEDGRLCIFTDITALTNPDAQLCLSTGNCFSNLEKLLQVLTPFTYGPCAATSHGFSSKISLLLMAKPQL